MIGTSGGEVAELLRAYRERGDLAARERLVEQHLPLVRALARRYAGRGEQLEDLVQVGAIGLIRAIDRFELERGVELTAYAIPTILGELKRHFRDTGWSVHVPRGLKDLSFRIGRLVETLSAELGRSPTVSELAQAAQVEEEEVVEALEVGRAYSTLSGRGGGRLGHRPARVADSRRSRLRDERGSHDARRQLPGAR